LYLYSFATSEKPAPITTPSPTVKNPAAVELGCLGGRKGGEAHAAKLICRKRTKIATDAAKKRWFKK